MRGAIDDGTSAWTSSSAEASATDLDSGGVNLSSGRSRLRGAIGGGTSAGPSSSAEASSALATSTTGLDGGDVFERGALVRFLEDTRTSEMGCVEIEGGGDGELRVNLNLLFEIFGGSAFFCLAMRWLA